MLWVARVTSFLGYAIILYNVVELGRYVVHRGFYSITGLLGYSIELANKQVLAGIILLIIANTIYRKLKREGAIKRMNWIPTIVMALVFVLVVAGLISLFVFPTYWIALSGWRKYAIIALLLCVPLFVIYKILRRKKGWII